MNPNACEIYKNNKLVGILPYKLVKKTDISEEHILLSNAYDIKPGYILLINKHEKLYVTDIRLHNPNENKLEVYFETGAARLNRKKQIRHDWKIAVFNTLGGAVAGFVTSFIFWLITN